MSTQWFGLIELLLVFGGVLGAAGWQWWEWRRWRKQQRGQGEQVEQQRRGDDAGGA